VFVRHYPGTAGTVSETARSALGRFFVRAPEIISINATTLLACIIIRRPAWAPDIFQAIIRG